MKVRNTIIVLVIVLVVTAIGFKVYTDAQTGYVVVATDSTSQSANISIGGNHAVLSKTVSSNNVTYKVRRGTYTVSIKRAGFTPLITNITVNTGDHLQVSGHLNFTHDPTITNVNQVPELSGNNYTLDSVNYFDGKTWAVLKLRLPGTDPAFVVTAFDISSGVWSVVSGPGTSFDNSQLRAMPNDVANYITNTLGS